MRTEQQRNIDNMAGLLSASINGNITTDERLELIELCETCQVEDVETARTMAGLENI